MQNNFSQEEGTSKVSRKQVEVAMAAKVKIHPVIFHILLSVGAWSAGEKWSKKKKSKE